MQGKHSRTSGNWPNLLPGEFGVNLADKALFLRAGGKKVLIPVEQVEASAAPPPGAPGAPLVSTEDGAFIDESLMPLGVIDGKVHTDLRDMRIDELSIPGVTIGTASDEPVFLLPAEQMLIEPFYVASEGFMLHRMAFNPPNGSGPVKFGITRPDGTPVRQQAPSSTQAGFASSDWNPFLLPVGWYFAYLWTSADLQLRSLKTYRPNRGFDLSAGAPIFVNRRFGTAGDYNFNTPLPLIEVVSTETSDQPVEDRCFTFRWTLE